VVCVTTICYLLVPLAICAQSGKDSKAIAKQSKAKAKAKAKTSLQRMTHKHTTWMIGIPTRITSGNRAIKEEMMMEALQFATQLALSSAAHSLFFLLSPSHCWTLVRFDLIMMSKKKMVIQRLEVSTSVENSCHPPNSLIVRPD